MRLRAGISAALASDGHPRGRLAGRYAWRNPTPPPLRHPAGTAGGTSTGSTARDKYRLDDEWNHRVSGSSGSSSGTTAGSSSSAGTSSSTGSSSSVGASAKAGGTYAGEAVQTRFGTVQVQVTVKAGVITDVTALHLTDQEQRSVQISARAAPLLRSEVLSAQSANVQTIGGATVNQQCVFDVAPGSPRCSPFLSPVGPDRTVRTRAFVPERSPAWALW